MDANLVSTERITETEAAYNAVGTSTMRVTAFRSVFVIVLCILQLNERR